MEGRHPVGIDVVMAVGCGADRVRTADRVTVVLSSVSLVTGRYGRVEVKRTLASCGRVVRVRFTCEVDKIATT